ncbi:MAG: hypothetical protein AAF960_07755 [Bacteroidota bacterium]
MSIENIENISTQVWQELNQQMMTPPNYPPLSSPNAEETLAFLSHNIPAIHAGNHFVEMKHTIEVDAKHRATVGDTATTLDFKAVEIYISGPRFTIPATNIHTIYPPQHSYGHYFDTLPYIILNRDTVPWERLNGEVSTDTKAPWLALLVFNDGELLNVTQPAKTSPAAAEFFTISPAKLGYTTEVGGAMPDTINVIRLNDYQHKPSIADMKALTHVIHDTASDGTMANRAVILANRLPAKGKRCTVHLVSLEKGWRPQMVSLYHWTFTNDDGTKSFERLEKVNTRNFTVAAEQLSPQMLKGFVPLEHRIIDGTQTLSWFHGPLVPVFANGKMLVIKRDDLSTARATDFLQADEKSAADGQYMLDVSYAAAWELGRLLTLENKQVALDLFRHKRQHAQTLKMQCAANSNFPLRFKSDDVHYPTSIQNWLDSLATLVPVPLNYLLPHPRMLSEESLHFVRLDYNWIFHLRQGALTVGEAWEKPQPDGWQAGSNEWIDRNKDYYTGFILRSQVVADYPDFVQEGYTDKEATQKLTKVIERKLDSRTLLCLFKGEDPIQSVVLRQHAKGMRYGFNFDENAYTKVVKSIVNNTIEKSNAIDMTDTIDETTGVLKIAALWNAIKQNSMETGLPQVPDSGQFGFKMTEGYPKYRFTRKDS